MRRPPPTALEYFELLPAERLLPMARVRQMIRKQWPDCKEDMSCGIPTYHVKGIALFALASQKAHITFYVLPSEMLDAFKHDLRTRSHGKSCIRFRHIEEPDMDLLERIVKFVGTTFTGSSTRLRGLAMNKR